MANRLNKILKKAKIREPLEAGKRNYDVPIMNGFRRFFNKINKETFSKDSPLAALIKKEFMMSHTGLLKLDKNYFHAHWKELVEEYETAIPSLTISPTERQKAEIKELRKEKNKAEMEKHQITKMVQEQQKAKEDIMTIVSDLKEKITNLEKKSES